MKLALATIFILGGLAATPAQAHLIAKPKSNTLKAIHHSQSKNLNHARYVCNNGKHKTKTWHCKATKWLEREKAQTYKLLNPPQPKLYVAPYPWHNIAICESSLGTGKPNWGINTGNGYYGGLQFDYTTWHEAQDNLGVHYSEYAHQAAPWQQVRAAMTLPLSRWPICGAPYR